MKNKFIKIFDFDIYKVIKICKIQLKIFNLFKYVEARLMLCASKALSINNLHQKVFTKYKNCNNGKNIVIVATGPSSKNFKQINDAIYLGVNRAFMFDNIDFDYLFLQDYSGATREYIEEFVNYNSSQNTKIFLGIIDDTIYPNSVIPEQYALKNKNIERYYVVHPTQKKTFTYDISTEPFKDAYSVVFPALQFALWTNPQKIYLVGCDCNLSGHFDKKDNFLRVKEVIDGYKEFKKFKEIYYPDTEIISINPVGLKGIFKDEYQNNEDGGN